ncbi:MAG: hypothetical protein IPI54_12590 [Chitinophagaceae bacterium]|nr:hypothetical protein [Chitinophagaceae bacterium]
MTIKTKMKKKAISKYVLMPGGSRLKSRVKKALEKAKAPQSTIKKLDKIAPVIATDRAGLLESDLHFIRSLVPLSHEIVNPRWVAYAGWNNQTGNPLGSMTAKLRVPKPRLINLALVYLSFPDCNQKS